VIETGDGAVVFIPHGYIKVYRLSEGWWLHFHMTFRGSDPAYREIQRGMVADSELQRDEYIARIREFAELLQ
jgi:hypothetical protein